MAEREYDIVLYGATGFTGHLVAERLLERAPQGTRIALAGRSLAKLGSVRDALGPQAAHWPLLLADSSNKSTMTKLARSTTAVASTVGPFAKYGLPLVEACARAGTHYADINGEVLFMRSAIDDYHQVAQDSGARIVLACGFDSLPSDLGVLVLHEAAGELGATTLVVTDMRGGASGGTVATMRLVAEEVKADAAAKAVVVDPYALSPDRDAEPDRVDPDYADDESDLAGAVHDPELGWLGPFVMAQMNTRVVRRSNALLGYAYSPAFRYREAIGFGEGVAARAKATGLGAGMGALGAAMGFGPARSGIGMVLPKPGEGPSPEDRAAGHFTMEIHGQGLDGEHYVATVAADGDPGYAATSLMLAEAVLFLASGSPDLPDRFGVLTPATGLGLPMVQRLRAAGMTFEAGLAPEPAENAAEVDAAVVEGDQAGGDSAEAFDPSI
ncbi:MAG TPA: saccharopine dehydrogenase NADP-binding domain-containing protein [Motilibacterales bacterium]|nr:saccharopine dehydrogenase NADP-binding domain-containing protein [Motilibacterales bacterium]